MDSHAKDQAKPLIVQTEDLDAEAAAWLAARAHVEFCPVHKTSRFDAIAGEAAALVVRTYTRVDAALLARMPALKVVGRAGVGIDNIDVEACRARGVRVVYTPDANSSAVAELVFALMLDATRPRVFLDSALEPARWTEVRRELRADRQLAEMTLGVVGLGRVGSRVARIGSAFGMNVVHCDLLPQPKEQWGGSSPVAFEELLAESDVISLHVDARPDNRHMISRRALASLKPSAVLINTSRGMVVDHAALAEFLKSHPSACALLDVHDPEPIEPGHPLLTLENAYLTPHIGAATRRAHHAMSWVVRDVWRVICGEAPEFEALSQHG